MEERHTEKPGPYKNQKTGTLARPYKNRKTGNLQKPENRDPKKTGKTGPGILAGP